MTDLRDKIHTLAEDIGNAAEKLADTARDKGEVAALELHQLGRKAGKQLKAVRKKLEK
jgi:ElaB/YqjD/DUF883 family membrane-anchored ribosome-binding protein